MKRLAYGITTETNCNTLQMRWVNYACRPVAGWQWLKFKGFVLSGQVTIEVSKPQITAKYIVMSAY